MTSDHPLRRLLARLCSADTMARVVDPTLADIRWERRRARWRGYLSLASALSLHVVSSIPSTCAGVWSEDGHAVARVTLLSTGAAVIVGAPLMASPFFNNVPNAAASRVWLMLTLMPQALVLSLPAALLVAIPIALSHRKPSTRLIRRVVLLSALYAGVTFGLMGWVVPSANQAFRVAASGIKELPKGLYERPFSGLKDEIERLRTFRGSDTHVRRLEVDYEVRLAFAVAAVPLGLAGLAFAFSPLGRKRPALVGVAGVILYLVVLFVIDGLLVRFVLLRTSLPATPLPWLPNAVFVLIAGVLTAITVRQSANRQSPIINRQ